MTAPAQVRTFVDRVLRLKAKQDDLAGDIKEVYAEAKASGFDKTIMGQLVAFLRKREKDPHKVEENGAIFDLYLHAYDSGTNVALAHAHEADLPPHDEDGVIIEPASAPSDAEDGQGGEYHIPSVALASEKGADAIALDAPSSQSNSASASDATKSDQPSIPAHRFRDGGLSAVIGPSRDGRADEFGKEDENSSNLSENPQSPSNRDVSADGKASSAAASQGQAAHAGTGSETLASHEGHTAGEGASASSQLNPAAGAAEQGLGAAPNTVPGPDLSQSVALALPVVTDAPVELLTRDPAPGAPFPCEANGWAGLEPLPQFDRRRPAA